MVKAIHRRERLTFICVSHVYIGRFELACVKYLCEQRRRTRDGLFYCTGQIFKVHKATTSGSNKPGLTLQFVVKVLDKVWMKGLRAAWGPQGGREGGLVDDCQATFLLRVKQKRRCNRSAKKETGQKFHVSSLRTLTCQCTSTPWSHCPLGSVLLCFLCVCAALCQ